MAVLRALMRVFSYLFHGLLTLFLLGLAVVALSSGQPLQLEMLPWQGQALTWWLLAAALVGLLPEVAAAVLPVEPCRAGDDGPRILLQPLLLRRPAGVLPRAVLDRRRADRGARSVVSGAPRAAAVREVRL